jgi:ectoine hydroxylase-related dioxygenase (phytanoyl-CoA dioxygenase family)
MLDFEQLDHDGFLIIHGLLEQSELDDFENAISTLVRAQLTAKDIQPLHKDPFEDIFRIGGKYTDRLYLLMERLNVLQQISNRLDTVLVESGFFDWAKIAVPLVWPDIRADINGDKARSLPVHQDFGSVKCETAWRLWIPLRPSNERLGSMRVYPKTHKHGVVSHNVSNPLQPYVDEELYEGVDSVVFDLRAGDAVLLDPLIFHASVPNLSPTTKFTLMIQIQDLATMIDPTDTRTSYETFTELCATRERARQELVTK